MNDNNNNDDDNDTTHLQGEQMFETKNENKNKWGHC